ncbi:MAG: hypothetical protein ACKOQM_11070 [Novosphingobium sp.]
MTGSRLIAFAIGVLLGLAPSQALARDFKIGGDVTISLGEGWSGTIRQNPAMQFAGMKDLMEDATEARLRTEGTGVLVSYMKFKTKKAPTEVAVDDAAMTAQSAKQVYGAQAVETDIVATVHQDGDVVRSFVTLHPKSGARFNVAPGYPEGCITSGTIRRGAAIHSISIASESCESAAHLEAVAAIFGPGQ